MMFNKLVVGLDGSEESQRALRWAITVASATGSITGVYGLSPARELLMSAVQIDYGPMRARIESSLSDDWLQPAITAGLDATSTLLEQSPATALISVADDVDADVIVVGNHGNTRWSKHHLGETPSRLIHKSRTPVVIINDDAELNSEPERIVVAIHGFGPVRHPGIDWSLRLATDLGAGVHLVHINVPLPLIGDNDAANAAARARGTERAMTGLVSQLGLEQPSLTITGETRTGGLVEELTKTSEGASLLVIGSHHNRFLDAVISGPATRHVPTTAHCPVVVVPEKKTGGS